MKKKLKYLKKIIFNILGVLLILSFLWIKYIISDFFKFEDSFKYYIVENYESPYLNKEFKLNFPQIYVSNLPYCNEVEPFIARNSTCLINKKAKFRLEELTHNCKGCLDKKRMPKPRRLIYNDNLNFKVIDSFIFKYEYLISYSELKFVLLKDNKGNIIEVPEMILSMLDSKEEYKMSMEEISIKKDYDDFKNNSSNTLTKIFCFQGYNIKNLKQYLKDFELENKIKLEDYSGCSIGEGFIINTKDFDSYITFRYYLNEWDIFGKWIP